MSVTGPVPTTAATLAAVGTRAATRIIACVPQLQAAAIHGAGRVSTPIAGIVSAIVRAGAVTIAAVPVRGFKFPPALGVRFFWAPVVVVAAGF